MAGIGFQFGGVFQLGPDPDTLTDYTCDIAGFVITEGRATVVKSPTFSNPQTEQKAAAGFGNVQMTFATNPGDSSGLWRAIRTAMLTTTGDLFFQVRYSTASVSATNPRFTGYIVISGLDTGAPVNQPLRQSQSFGARSLSGPLSA